jgi:ATP-dependent helicase/nuclease subunit B
MTAGAVFPLLDKPELFSRLAQGHGAGTVVVTPNQRLAHELAREFHEQQITRGLKAWETADILPFTAFVERLYEDVLYSAAAQRVPLLLTPVQEWELWQAAIRASDWSGMLLSPASAAEDCRHAWELAHAWGIADALGSFPGNEDAAAFVEWARSYSRRCARERGIDAARLPDIMAPLLGEPALRTPQWLVAYGYDVMPPQVCKFMQACEERGIGVRQCGPVPRYGHAVRATLPSAREELELSALWARDRLEAGAKRIGVVVADLGRRRKEVARVFGRVMHPAHNLPGAPQTLPPFNISLGAPLAQYPLPCAALAILGLAFEETRFEQASRLVRSPFIGAAQAELNLRAQLDARLRTRAPASLSLGKLVGLVEGAPLLRRHLEDLFRFARGQADGERSPAEWGRIFSDCLDVAGYPGERSLDSDEFQSLAKFNEVLAGFATLERVTPRLTCVRALARLRHLCTETLFQPQTPDAPVQVLGILESAGLEFDALWVSGLTDDAWPIPARINPFIPPALQRKAGIPDAAAETSLAHARKITAGWLAAAGEVVISHPAMEQDRVLLPSPLINAIAPGTPAISARSRYRDLIFATRRIETLPDGRAIALPTREPRGGTRILADQAACPFRAFARHRLSAQALEAPQAGPDARTRGQMLHALMKALWEKLRDSDALAHDCTAAIEDAARLAVAQAELDEPFAALERQRLAKLAASWLAIERGRPAFEVVAVEQPRKLKVAGLELKGRIDRLDRLASGGYALIDYKAGRPNPNEWMGERPDDPQLPLYALSAQEDIAALAFAKLKTGEMRYMGFSRGNEAIPGVKAALDWEALVADWSAELELLGREFAGGDARVAPKKGLQTCRYCDLQTLCRIYEKVNVLAEEGEDEGG